MPEVWKAVVGYEGLYEVSSIGRVRSLTRKVKHSMPSLEWRTVQGQGKKLQVNVYGYFCIGLYKLGKLKVCSVHRLVACAFIPNPLDKPQVNHIDGVKQNNAVENLEWCTSSENCIHALDAKLYRPANGVRRWNAKLTDDKVREIRALVAAGTMHKVIAEQYGIGRKAITKIANNQRWQHVI